MQTGPRDTFPDRVVESARETAREIKPKLRGWLHLATAPLAFFSFIVLLVLAEDPRARAGVAVFMVCALALFVVSAIYHTGTWREGVQRTLRRVDHSNIFLM